MGQLIPLLDTNIVIALLNGSLNPKVITTKNAYIATRYPADVPEASWQDAEQALISAKGIGDVILKSITSIV